MKMQKTTAYVERVEKETVRRTTGKRKKRKVTDIYRI